MEILPRLILGSIPVFVSTPKRLKRFPEYKRVDVRTPWFPQPLCSSPQFLSPTSGLVPFSLTTLMFSKAVITFLTIGALWLNVSAIPIPANGYTYPPPAYSQYLNNGETNLATPPPAYLSSSGNPAAGPPQGLGNTPGRNPAAGPPNQRSRSGCAIGKGELPRSFSALSYRDLTFVFSVAGAIVIAATFVCAAGYYLVFHFKKKGDSKREPMFEDWAPDSISSPLKHESEPAPPFL